MVIGPLKFFGEIKPINIFFIEFSVNTDRSQVRTTLAPNDSKGPREN